MPLTLRMWLLAVLPACVGPAMYGTARPVAVGELQVHATLELFADGRGVLAPEQEEDLVPVPMPAPGVGFRWGVADGLDAGTRLSMVTGIELDMRWLAAESGPLVLALSPLLVFGPFQGAGRLMADIEAARWLSVGLRATGGALLDDGLVERTLGGGASLLIALGDTVAVQPSLSSTWRSDRRFDHPELVMGLAFVMGRRR